MITGLVTGTTYYWSVQTIDNTYGASEFSEEHTFYFSLTNTDNHFLNNLLLKVYPNPTQDYIILTLPEGNFDNIRFDIYTAKGEKVLEKQANTGELIDISEINKGIYFLKAKIKDNIFTEKLIIK